jgi:hypothetical protein
MLLLINFLIKSWAWLNYKRLFDVKFTYEIFRKYCLRYLLLQRLLHKLRQNMELSPKTVNY